jgi:DNA-binding NarL/FixJ family response regulator
MLAFSGTCLVHRAEVLQFRGAWPQAMAEACRATDRAGGAVAPAAGAALYRRGELHRLRGELAAAEECFGRAARLGTDVQPGLALLRTAQGRVDAACASLRRVLAGTSDPLRRAAMLPAHVDILLVAHALDDARNASAELEQIARAFEAEALQALASQVRGAVKLASGDARAALAALRDAFEAWQRLEAPYETARARVLLALACRALGDDETAAIELDAAEATFERLGAAPDLARLDALRTRRSVGTRRRLTARELQVLRLVASGDTNRTIAARLHLSERTVDRHVSNTLAKLEVRSRAAAIAYAYEHRLL